MASEYASPTLKFVMIQLAEPAKTAELTFAGARRAAVRVRHDVRRAPPR